MNSLLLYVILPLWVALLIVQARLGVLAQKLYVNVTGTKDGYTYRAVAKNMERFSAPPNEELAGKVQSLDRLLRWIIVAMCAAFFIGTLVLQGIQL